MFILSTNEINGLPMAEKDGKLYFYDMVGAQPFIYGVVIDGSFMLVEDDNFNIEPEQLTILEAELEAQLATKH